MPNIQFMPYDEDYIKDLMSEAETELNSLPTSNELIIPSDETLKFDNSKPNPIFVLFGIQSYSSNQFMSEIISALGFDEERTDETFTKKKIKLMMELEETILKIRKNDKFETSNDYLEWCKHRKINILPDNYDPQMLSIQQIINEIFLLKAHFLHGILFRTNIKKEKEDNSKLFAFVEDYKKFLKYKMEEMKLAMETYDEYPEFEDIESFEDIF